MRVFRGTLVHCKVPHKLEVLRDHIIGIDEKDLGKILFVQPASDIDELSEKYAFDKRAVHTMSESQFLMPGLIDTHIHAPQYVNVGTGYDRMLLDWLNTYTFPTEARFKDVEVAKHVYPLVVKRTLRNGTTTACYFATIHLEATKELCRVAGEFGQRAFVGKVCMDMQSPSSLTEDTQQSLEDTKKLIQHVREMKNPLVQPVITPRFAPTCSTKLLQGLGEIAHDMDVHVQSHICEQQPEVEFTLQLFPEHEHCASIFDKCGLLTDKTVMAHCIYLEDSEIEIFQRKGVGISHCPNSNLCICSGILDARSMLDRGMKIGLGTDVSGGFSSSMFDAMRMAVHVSKALSFSKHKGYKVITHNEALYMATLGGAKVLAIDDKIGNFEVGKQFDALLIDVKAPRPETPVFDIFEHDKFDDVITKLFYLGDDRNILKVFVAGREAKLD